MDTFNFLILFLCIVDFTVITDSDNMAVTTNVYDNTVTTDSDNNTVTTDEYNTTVTTDSDNTTVTTDEYNTTENLTVTTDAYNTTGPTDLHTHTGPTDHHTLTDRPTTTSLPCIIPIQFESMQVKLPFSLRVNLTFPPELNISSSEKYQNYSKEFQKELFKIFETTPGLHTIEITNFSYGSIWVYYNVVIYRVNRESLIKSLEYINNTVTIKLQNKTMSIFSKQIYIEEINMTSELQNALKSASGSNICEIFVNPCKFGYICKDTNNQTACHDRCHLDTPHCSSDGECYIDYKSNELKCRCRDTNEYVYIGEKCEIAIMKVQALSLSVKDYAIIAGSAAGAVVVIIIVINLIKCLRKRGKKDNKSEDTNSERSDLNGAEPSVHNSQINAPRNIKATFQNKAYMHESGLSELNKNLRVYRDPQTGEEALIYQPVNINKPLSSGNRDHEYVQSEQTSRRSVYDSIDTDHLYKIKRPNLTESRKWPL